MNYFFTIILIAFLSISPCFAQNINWAQMANTTWELQSVYDAEGKVIQHTDEKLCFHDSNVDSEGIARMSYTWDNLPMGGKITGGQINARGNQLVIFDLPDEKSAEYFIISSWDRAAQTMTMVDQWGLKRIFKCSAPIQLGSAFATNSLAICYYTGKGVIKDFPEAFRLFKMAADSGNPAAFANVARCYMFGQGTNVNPKVGIKWYEKAAKKGYADSQFFLGQLFYEGHSEYCEGVNIPVDYMKAARFLRMAIENPQMPDYAKGETYRLLASCYRFGRGVEADEVKADELTARAASFGDSSAEKIMEWLNVK